VKRLSNFFYLSVVFGPLVFCWPVVAHSVNLENFSLNADVTMTLDDNQSRAERTRDQIEDISASVMANLSWFRPFRHRHLLIISGFAETEQFDESDVLNRVTLGLSTAWRWQPSSAFRAPIVEWNVSVQNDDIRTDQRDSTLVKSQLFVTRRFTDRITMSAGAEYRQAISDSDVFELSDNRIFFNFDYLLMQRYALYATYSHIRGDLFSSAQRVFCNGVFATDILPLINASKAIEADDAYNNSQCGEWIAYRLNGTTNTLVGGVNMPFGKSASLDVSIMHVDVSADLGNRYERNLVRASLLKRF